MSMQLQSTSTVLSVSMKKTELLTEIKNEPPEPEIGIDDIPNSLDEEIIPDIKNIDIVSHVLSEDLIKNETVSENTFETNHSGSAKTQVFIKTENIPLTKTENITQSEYLYKTQDISDGNVSRGTSQGVTEVESKEGNCSCDKDKKKGRVIEIPVIPIEPHKYTSLAKTKHACNNNKITHEQNKKSYCCDKCTYKTCWLSGFKRHKLTHLKPEEIQYFYCYHCPCKCKVKNSIKIHIFNHFKKEEVPFHCYICNFTTLKRNLIIEHFKKHPKHHSKCDETDYKNQLETYTKKQMRYYCEKCTYTSVNSSEFKLHQLTHKTKAEIDDRLLKYRCDKCKYKTYRYNCFRTHKLSHLKPEEIHYFYCYHCSYKSKHKINLQRHILRHFKNEDVPFHCYICDFTTLKRNLIIEHFKKHPKHHSKCDEIDYKNQLEIPYFYCYHCSYKSKRKDHLKNHIFTHFKREEIPFHCYICDFVTLKRDLIIEHFKPHPKHHSKCDETEYKYQLQTCKKRYSSCKKCSYRTYYYERLKLHELTHKTEMDDRHFKYRCHKCKYKTFRHQNFKTHKLIHLKPEEIQYFYCYHCSYKSNRKQYLKVHIFNHFKKEEVPFHCYICDFVTLKREFFKKHLKHHNRCDEPEYRNQLLKFYKIL